MFFIILLIELNFKMNPILGMILFDPSYLGVSFCHNGLQIFLVIFCPFIYWQFLHMNDTCFKFIELYDAFYFIISILFWRYRS